MWCTNSINSFAQNAYRLIIKTNHKGQHDNIRENKNLKLYSKAGFYLMSM
jgi:hypothetical protein